MFADADEINDLLSAKKMLHESREAFMLLFNNSPICMSMTSVTPEKRVYHKVNKKFMEVFGYTEADIVGRTSVEVGILDHEESQRVGTILKETGRIQNEYVRCIAKNKSIVHTVSSIEKMTWESGTYFVAFFINVTKILEQQMVIEQQLKQLETVNAQLEAFSYSVSHDLRAPLRGISGFAAILSNDHSAQLDSEGLAALSKIQINAKQMNVLIDDLLAFARLGKTEVRKVEISMKPLIEEVLSDLHSTDHKAHIVVHTVHNLYGDRSLVKQVLINLIANGIKYSSKKEQPRIDIDSRVENNVVIYTVSDNGDGFDMKYADKLFGVFQRLHSNEEFEGTGVGLATVKRIISKHGGQIQAQGEVGKGAVFTFGLPMQGEH